jgi:hypothetical protein
MSRYGTVNFLMLLSGKLRVPTPFQLVLFHVSNVALVSYHWSLWTPGTHFYLISTTEAVKQQSPNINFCSLLTSWYTEGTHIAVSEFVVNSVYVQFWWSTPTQWNNLELWLIRSIFDVLGRPLRSSWISNEPFLNSASRSKMPHPHYAITTHRYQLAVTFSHINVFCPLKLNHSKNFLAGWSFQRHFHSTSTCPMNSIWLTLVPSVARYPYYKFCLQLQK